jgi:hypothetical protein
MGQNSVVVYSQAIQAHLQAIVSPVPVFAAFNRNFSSTPRFVVWMLRDVHQPVYPGAQGNKGIDRPTFQISVFTQQTNDGFTISQQILNALHGYSGILGKTNLLTQSECANGLADVGNFNVSAGSFYGLSGNTGISFAAGVYAYAYKTFLPVEGVSYTFSVFVRMNDGGPVSASNGYNGDFSLIANNTIYPSKVYNIDNSLYRVSVTFIGSTANIYDNAVVVAKFTTQTDRAFSISGFQLETGDTVGEYIPSTTGPGGLQVSKADVQWLYHSYNDDEKMAQVFLDCTFDIPT